MSSNAEAWHLRTATTMHFRLVFITATAATLLAMTSAREPSQSGKHLKKHHDEILGNRAQDESRKRVAALEGGDSWLYSDETRGFFHDGSDLGIENWIPMTDSPDEQRMWNEQYVMARGQRRIRDEARMRLRHLKKTQGPKDTKYTLPIIRFVSEVDYDAIDSVQ